jgi:hypothetical protein
MLQRGRLKRTRAGQDRENILIFICFSDTEVWVCETEIGEQSAPARLCTNTSNCGGQLAYLRRRGGANVEYAYVYREAGNFMNVEALLYSTQR